jgi:hypothetical protein
LQYIDVSKNAFSSTLPSAVGLLSDLIDFDASDNRLTGSIPPELGGLVRLQSLLLSSNSLRGIAPSQLCELSSLQSLDISRNYLTGRPPLCLSALGKLGEMSLAWNRFTGPLDFLAGVKASTIDVSGNAFAGELPSSVFELTSLVTFAAAANCLSGALPAAICEASALQTLVLDGLSAGAACRVPLFPASNVFKFTGSKTLNKMQGSVPPCIFSALPNITTLHISGNDLSGSLPNIESWPARLRDLSLSHNRLSGSIPAALQRGLRQFSVFDVAFNRLDGELGAVLLAPGSGPGPKLGLRVNRFSGTLSASIVAAPSVQVLEGNLIACPRGRQQLPASDPYSQRFKCGSDTLDDYLVAFAVMAAMSACVLVYVGRRAFPALSGSELRAWLDPQMEAPEAVAGLVSSLRRIRVFSVLVAAALVVLLLPIYGAASSLQGNHADLYAWTVSAAFKSGVGSAAVFMAAWVVFLLVCYIHLSQYRRAAAKMSSEQTGVAAADVKTGFLRALRLLCVSVVDAVCVLVPNVGYVLVVDSQNNSAQIATGLALSVFKLLWSWVVLPRLLASTLWLFGLADGHKERQQGSDFVLELALRAMNSVVAPTVALLAADASCFSQALYVSPPVESAYSTEVSRVSFGLI